MPSGSTRAEHLAWCKRRALDELDAGSITNAWASMASDLGKHPGTAASVDLIGLGMATSRTPAEVRRFIEGFQ